MVIILEWLEVISLPDDDPIGGALGPAGVDPRMPPVDRRRRGNRDNRRHNSHRSRRSSLRADSPEERKRALRELQAEVDRGNQLLLKLGHQTTLELVPGRDGAPDRVAICYPGDSAGGARCVVRTVRLRELQQWLARLEGLEGLVIDTER